MALLQPDRLFSRVSDIDIDRDVRACGISTVLLDIDNTLRSRVDGMVPPDVRAWMERCRREGVALCLLSNNWHANVFDLAASLDVPIVAKAMKPLPPGYLSALRTMHAKARNTVVVGDQLFTDIWGAKALGMHAYLVAPLSEVDLPYMAALRTLERAIVGQGAPSTPVPVPAPARSVSAGRGNAS